MNETPGSMCVSCGKWHYEIVCPGCGSVVTANGGDWRSKSLALLLKFSTTLDGFYFANCVLADAIYRIIN